MRRKSVVISAIAAALLSATGLSVAQDKDKSAEKLKDFGPIPTRVVHMQTAFNPALPGSGEGVRIFTRTVKHMSGGTLAINPTLYQNVGYDPRKDFAPVGLIGTSALVVLVNPNLPARSIPELIALAKKEPGKLNYASAGVGSGIHLGTVLFELMADIKLTHVPYRGSAPALTDLIGGHVSIYFSSLPPVGALASEGKVRALAVTGAKRSEAFPNLPTVAEAGLPGFEAVLHYGIVAPAGTPRPIIDKLNAALRDALNAPDTKERMAKDGTEPLPSTPEEYATDIDREETKWSTIVKKSGAKAE